MSKGLFLLVPLLFALACGGGDGAEESDTVAVPDTMAVRPMSDEQFEELFTRVTAQLMDSVEGDATRGSRRFVRRFSRSLGRNALSELQRQRARGFFEGLMVAQPEESERLGRYLFSLQNLMIGDVAPNITGTDYDGVELRLLDFRGKVTVLYFTGNWCGPCRSEYPFQREMLETFKDEPFAIVAVNSDKDPVEAKQAKIDEGLAYPAWFDGGGTRGPIATQWGVTAWPTVYILDHEGVIRFVGRRKEATGAAARYLLDEMASEAKTTN